MAKGDKAVVIREVTNHRFNQGDLVKVASLEDKLTFCIIGFKYNAQGNSLAILKGLFNQDVIIEKPVAELTNLLIRGIL
ncbi:MAG: hypothetical protein GX825_09690 [Syntrophomonadaceae bacterium]|nr:hypothetical protein [Syntrophomonadaceae bacterium]